MLKIKPAQKDQLLKPILCKNVLLSAHCTCMEMKQELAEQNVMMLLKMVLVVHNCKNLLELAGHFLEINIVKWNQLS